MKQTVQEAAKEMCEAWGMEDNHGYGVKDTFQVGFVQGAQWQNRQSPWINAKEQVPNESECVLALIYYKGKFQIHRTVYNLDIDDKWCFGNNGEVIAWIPIPSLDDILEDNKDVLKQ